MRKLIAWWIRLHRQGAAAGLRRARLLYQALERSRKARIDRDILARLDARSLRDIGLQSWNAELAERLEAQRQRRLLRLAAARIGVY